MKHKHYDLIVAWASGEQIQFFSPFYEEWQDLLEPIWDDNKEYRIKPEISFVNGCAVVMPETITPKEGTPYYVIDLTDKKLYCQCDWEGDENDVLWLERGLIFLKKEDAIEYAAALLKPIIKD